MGDDEYFEKLTEESNIFFSRESWNWLLTYAVSKKKIPEYMAF